MVVDLIAIFVVAVCSGTTIARLAPGEGWLFIFACAAFFLAYARLCWSAGANRGNK